MTSFLNYFDRFGQDGDSLRHREACGHQDRQQREAE